jgi:cobalt/nickel transport system permease protein
MSGIESSFVDVTYLDTLSYQDTCIHRLDPRTKLLTTLVFTICVVSFDKYQIAALLPLVVYPVVLVALGNLPLGYLLKKILLAAPFAFFLGVFNPFFDRAVVMQLGPVAVSGGWVSFFSIMIRFTLTVSGALLLIASTGFNSVCMAVEKMGAPRSFAVQLLFLYRYIFVLADEASRMVRARALRSFGRGGMGMSVFTSMIGQLLLRTLDRAQRIHLAMRCRGFDGTIRMVRPWNIRGRDALFFLGWSALFVLMRLYDIPQGIGRLVVELTK